MKTALIRAGGQLAVPLFGIPDFGREGDAVTIVRDGDTLVIRRAVPTPGVGESSIDDAYSSDQISCGRNFRP